MLDTMTEHFNANTKLSILTASAGIAAEYCPDDRIHNIEALMHKSDAALYTAKNSGKGRYCVYSGEE